MNNRNPLPIPFLSRLIIISSLQLFFSDQIFVSSANEDQYYQTCGNTFNCGNVTGIKYPFRASNDPSYCGYPGLVLECDADNKTSIIIAKQPYVVLGISPSSQTMRIAREDVVQDICPSLVNATLDFSLFDYSANYINLTFIYGCPLPLVNSPLLLNPFPCASSGVYFTYGAQGPGICGTSVIYPVLGTISGFGGGPVNVTVIDQLLQEGFDIRWKVDTSACIHCTGMCGYDSTAAQTGCFCPDPPYWTTNGTCLVAAGNNISPRSAPTPHSGTKWK